MFANYSTITSFNFFVKNHRIENFTHIEIISRPICVIDPQLTPHRLKSQSQSHRIQTLALFQQPLHIFDFPLRYSHSISSIYLRSSFSRAASPRFSMRVTFSAQKEKKLGAIPRDFSLSLSRDCTAVTPSSPFFFSFVHPRVRGGTSTSCTRSSPLFVWVGVRAIKLEPTRGFLNTQVRFALAPLRGN